MKKAIAVLISVIVIVALTGCGHTSSYKATGFVHTNHAQDASMSFFTFDGRMVFKLNGTGEGEITYSGKLESGSAKVYYEYLGVKDELFSIGSGEEISSHSGYVDKGTVYIIVETDGQCENGEFDFSVK